MTSIVMTSEALKRDKRGKAKYKYGLREVGRVQERQFVDMQAVWDHLMPQPFGEKVIRGKAQGIIDCVMVLEKQESVRIDQVNKSDQPKTSYVIRRIEE